MPKTAVMIACGDIGTRFALGLDPDEWRRVAMRRRTELLPAQLEAVSADLLRPETLGFLAGLQPYLLLFTPTPTGRSVEGYRQGFEMAAQGIVDALADHPPEQVLMVSSTRVYAEVDGDWVDEDAPLATEDPVAGSIIRAEQLFLDAFGGACILRSGGLYGDGPGYLLRRVAAGELTPPLPLRFSNRIHREDLVAALHWLAGNRRRHRVYNAVDDAPVPTQEVERWLCEQLGVDWAPRPSGPAEPRGHKRVSNQRLHDTGFEFRFPNYRAGYAEVLRDAAPSQGENGFDFD